MAKQNLTIFQKLNKILGPDLGNTPKQVQSNKYSINSGELLKTTDKSEYDKAKLQAQQTRYLSGLWRKVEGELFQNSIHYETTRIGSYADFESMEFFPEIATALDIFSEESCTLNNNGRMLNIYSDSKRVKSILEDLFFNRLDLHTSLPMWTRNTVKYGDNFLFLNIDGKHGIIGGRQMPNFEMERREGDIINSFNYRSDLNSINNSDTEDKPKNKVKFFWRGKDMEFNSWQIAHFRLLGDDRKLPYGTSILEKARRIWKQLLISEDSMLVYRVTRAPERRVFKIYVGNIDDEDVGPYVNEIANRFKRTPIIDPKTGQMDLRYNQMSNDQDFFIPVRSEDAPNPIDVLPGAANLDQIADIEFLQKKLFTALRVPKAFLGFEEATGDGKNLALQDIRFSRTVNRIQQSMLQELNKIAIIHLCLLGFDDEFDNFTLTLNNPSTQAEMLKVEHLQAKVTLVKDSVVDTGNGFAVMSMTRAKREILGWSDDEIRQDLLEQRMEKAAAAELANSGNVIKHTGMFDIVDKIYGDYDLALKGGGSSEGGDNEEGGASSGGGGFGGGGLGAEDLDFGDETDAGTEESGEENASENAGENETETTPGAEKAAGNEIETPKESLNRLGKLLIEEKEKINKQLIDRKNKYQTLFVDKLANQFKPKDIPENVKIYDKNIKINEGIGGMIKDIDDMLNQ